MELLRKHKRTIAMIILGLTALTAFRAALGIGFIWDDHQFIEANPHIKTWTTASLKHAFLSDPFNQSLNYYRPFQTLSNMLDFSVWKLNPFGYHLTNLLFHAAGTLLAFILAGELGLCLAAAFLAALFFAVNPTGIEQLIIVAGRAEIASSAFTLASVLFFLRRGYALSFLAFLIALGFKENGIITPFLTALALWYLRKDKREYLRLPPFLLPIPFYLWLRHAATGAGVLDNGIAEFISQAAIKLPPAVLIYIKNALLPLNMHSHRMQPDFAPWFYAAYAVCALVLYGLIRYKPRAAILIAGWYVLNLAPKVPLLAGGDLMLEHWTYLANLGLYAAAGAWAAGAMESGGRRRAAGCIFAGGLALFWITAADANIRLRSTDLKIYENAALYSSSKPMLYNLAREYYLTGKFEKSRDILTRISALDPGNAMYQNGLALSLWKTGDRPGASGVLDRLLARDPDNAPALVNKACFLIEGGEPAEAEKLLKRAIGEQPDDTSAHSTLAGLYLRRGKEEEALAAYETLLRLDPYDLQALTNAGILNAKNRRYDAAEKLFGKALSLSPGSRTAALNLDRLRALKR
jgi:tetratricopeptide (TPR) repeat protein